MLPRETSHMAQEDGGQAQGVPPPLRSKREFGLGGALCGHGAGEA